MARTVLCYGDSNTWGQVPLKAFAKSRHAFGDRWPGRLQQLTEGRYRIVEEGLNGRTTGPEDPIREGRSGRVHLPACIDSHVPLDLVILMLGTNDLKMKFKPDPVEINRRMRELVVLTKTLAISDVGPSQILVMAPVIPKRTFVYEDFHAEALEDNARALVQLYQRMSREEGVHFLDASKHLEASEIDGVHLEPSVHRQFAEVLLKRIETILGG